MTISSAVNNIRDFNDKALQSFQQRDQGESRATRVASGLGEVAGGIVATIPFVGGPLVAAVAGIDHGLAKLAGEQRSIAAARIGTWALWEGVAVTAAYVGAGPIAAMLAGGIMATAPIVKGFGKVFTK